MNIVSFCGTAIIVCVLALVLRRQKPEMSLLITIAAGAVLFFIIIDSLIPALNAIGNIVENTGAEEYIEAVFKAFGICLVTGIGSEICKDAGQNAVAGYIETAGRVSILIVSLPMLSAVLSSAAEIISG